LARLITVHELAPGEKIEFSDRGSPIIILLIRGELVSEKAIDLKFSKKVILTPGMNIDADIDCLKASKATLVLTADRYRYFNLLVDNTKILQHIFDSIHEKESN
jgi:hypothetical protein